MKLINSVSIVLVCVFGIVLGGGCSAAKNVRRTLALNDIHIQAGIAEEKGDDARAYELWSEYVDRRPQSVMAEYRLGKVEMRLGKTEQAIVHLRIAHDLKPGNIDYLLTLADAMVTAGWTDSLMQLLAESGDEGAPGDGQLRIAHYAQEIGLMDEAREALLLAIVQVGGESFEPYLEMANFSHMVGDREGEIANLRHVLWFDHSNTVILGRLEAMGMIAGPSLAVNPAP